MDHLINESEPITFTCQAVGQPVPNIVWYFNGNLINESNKDLMVIINMINITTTSTLTVNNTQSAHVGTYTCVASNDIGSVTSSGVLTVNGMQYVSYFTI